MSEPTIALTFADIYGRILTNSGGSDTAKAKQFANDGYRVFLAGGNPRHLTDRNVPAYHKWSFLSPMTTLTAFADVAADDDVTVDGTAPGGVQTITATGGTPFKPEMVGHTLSTITEGSDYTIIGYSSSTVVTVTQAVAGVSGDTFTIDSDGWVALPSTFGGFIESSKQLTYPIGLPNYPPITVIDLMELMNKRTRSSDYTFYPQFAALRPLDFVTTTGLRWGLEFFPAITTDTVLTYNYQHIPQLMTADAEYPIGGPLLSQTIYEAGEMMRERSQNDRPGPHTQLFNRFMITSIVADQRNSGPDFIGPTLRRVGKVGTVRGDVIYPNHRAF